MAPEVIKEVGHGRKADIWSVGCCVLEMATARPPWSEFGDHHIAALFKIVNSQELPSLPETLSSAARDFIIRCLNRDPDMRPSAEELLSHPFITKGSQRSEQVGSSGTFLTL